MESFLSLFKETLQKTTDEEFKVLQHLRSTYINVSHVVKNLSQQLPVAPSSYQLWILEAFKYLQKAGYDVLASIEIGNRYHFVGLKYWDWL